jgi:hypothetical protein
MNRYKIDANSYISGEWKYALYVKRPWSWRWHHLESFKTIEDAKAMHGVLVGLPIYL